MIATLVNGGLGNMLFQICNGLNIALAHNDDFYILNYNQNGHIIKDKHGADVNGYKATIFHQIPNINIDSITANVARIEHNQNCFHYISPPYIHDCLNIYNGYYQSEKFFTQEEHKIRELFTLAPQWQKYIYEKFPMLTQNCACAHIRRGDYLGDEHHHPILPISYYQDGVAKIGDIDHIFIFSNDLQWCKEYLNFSNMVFVNECDWISLYIMAECKKHILANSSFSWWGAKFSEWFNTPEIIIAPEKWFGSAYVHLNTEDLLPERWIKIAI